MASSRPLRVRSQPHRLANEQEDEHFRDETAQVLAALHRSVEPASDSTDTDIDSDDSADDSASDEKVDEDALASSLDEKEKEVYDKLRATEVARGWTTQHSPVIVQPFLPPAPGRVPC